MKRRFFFTDRRYLWLILVPGRKTHTDKVSCKYAFTFNADRRFDSAACRHYQTRSSMKSQAGPPGGGSSFVDVSLRVVVRQARGTMMAIKPEYLHGTTKGYGAVNSGVTIAFSERVGKAWQLAMDGKISVESFLSILDSNGSSHSDDL